MRIRFVNLRAWPTVSHLLPAPKISNTIDIFLNARSDQNITKMTPAHAAPMAQEPSAQLAAPMAPRVRRV